jgi:hypothetical protein
MADVVVDQKPKPQLPYDPNDIPDAVKQRVAAVEAMYSNGNQPASAPEQSPAPEPPPSPQPPSPQQPSVFAQPSTPTPPAEPVSENADSWRVRYVRMQGQWNAAQKTIGEMQEQMAQLGNELVHAQQAPRSTPQTQAPTQPWLTQQDVDNYGAELIDVTQRAALHAIQPKLAEVEQQNAELQRRLAVEARRRLDQAVEVAVPNYRDIDRNPRWHRWLLGVDVLSGRVRQQLLNEAIAQASAPRVISFFKGFLAEEEATGHIEPASAVQQPTAPRTPALPLASLAAPGRARPATGGDTSMPTDKPTYTRPQIAQLYRLHQKGAYVGREAEWARQERDIIAAGNEGRIR